MNLAPVCLAQTDRSHLALIDERRVLRSRRRSSSTRRHRPAGAGLAFYRSDGSLIDEVVVSNLGDLSYGFGTLDESYSIKGILIQNTDSNGIGVAEICYETFPSTQRVIWGSLKGIYR